MNRWVSERVSERQLVNCRSVCVRPLPPPNSTLRNQLAKILHNNPNRRRCWILRRYCSHCCDPYAINIELGGRRALQPPGFNIIAVPLIYQLSQRICKCFLRNLRHSGPYHTIVYVLIQYYTIRYDDGPAKAAVRQPHSNRTVAVQ